jgi:hypothetical protein
MTEIGQCQFYGISLQSEGGLVANATDKLTITDFL